MRQIFSKWANALVLALGLSVGAIAAHAAGLGGNYVGIDEAEGLALWLAPEKADPNAIRGKFVAPDGIVYILEGRQVPTGAAGTARRDGETFQSAAFDARLEGAGIAFTWIPQPLPIERSNTIDVTRAVTFAFVREGTVMPELPPYLRPAPTPATQYLNGIDFVDSYPFWPADAVVHGYGLLSDNERTLLRIFGHIQTDILWRMCQAGGLSRTLTEALIGQGVDCKALVDSVAAMQRKGTFAKYKNGVAAERKLAREVIACGQGMLGTQQCAPITQAMSAAALNTTNARQVLAAYR